MKKFILIPLCLMAGGLVLVSIRWLLSADQSLTEGRYVYAHRISVAWERSQEMCEQDNGTWDAEQEACFFDGAEDQVNIQKILGGYQVEISTLATNAHDCGFMSREVKKIDKHTWLATAREKAEKDGTEIICEVEIGQLSSEAISVEPRSSEGCLFFCGARASLRIERATRQD
jgi:hypothetical protein